MRDTLYGGPLRRAALIEKYARQLKESGGKDAVAREWLEILAGAVVVTLHPGQEPALLLTGTPATCRRPLAYQCDCGRWLRVRKTRYGQQVKCRKCGLRLTLHTTRGRQWTAKRELAGQVRRCGAELTVAVDQSGVPYRRCTRCAGSGAAVVALGEAVG